MNLYMYHPWVNEVISLPRYAPEIEEWMKGLPSIKSGILSRKEELILGNRTNG